MAVTRLQLMQNIASRLGVYEASTVAANLSSGATTLTNASLAAWGAEAVNGVIDIGGQVRSISTVDPCTGVITFCPALTANVAAGAACVLWPLLPKRLAELVNVAIRNSGERFMVTREHDAGAYSPSQIVYALPSGAMSVADIQVGSDALGWQSTRTFEVHVVNGVREVQMRGIAGGLVSAGNGSVTMRITYLALPTELTTDGATLDEPDNGRELALFIEEFALGVAYERRWMQQPASDVGRAADKAAGLHYNKAREIWARQRGPITPAYTRGRVFAAQI